jgi:hypothetical protein
MNMRSLLILTTLTAAGCAVGAPGAVVREPVPLLAGLRSYESPAESRAKLSGADWSLREVGVNRPADNRPKYEKQTAEFKWQECGQDGTLILTYVNERLYITSFVPANLDACLKDLTDRGVMGPANRDQRVRIYTGELDGKRFVAATDTRLESEIEAWISRYS